MDNNGQTSTLGCANYDVYDLTLTFGNRCKLSVRAVGLLTFPNARFNILALRAFERMQLIAKPLRLDTK